MITCMATDGFTRALHSETGERFGIQDAGRSTTRRGGAAAASDWITGVKNRIVKCLQVMTFIEPQKTISLAQVAN